MGEEGKNKTSLGMDENIEGLLCYLFGWVTGIIFLILEKDNRFVKFHATQSLVTFLVMSAAITAARWIPILHWLLVPILGVMTFILWLVLILNAYNGRMLKLPFIGDIAEKQANG